MRVSPDDVIWVLRGRATCLQCEVIASRRGWLLHVTLYDADGQLVTGCPFIERRFSSKRVALTFAVDLRLGLLAVRFEERPFPRPRWDSNRGLMRDMLTDWYRILSTVTDSGQADYRLHATSVEDPRTTQIPFAVALRHWMGSPAAQPYRFAWDEYLIAPTLIPRPDPSWTPLEKYKQETYALFGDHDEALSAIYQKDQKIDWRWPVNRSHRSSAGLPDIPLTPLRPVRGDAPVFSSAPAREEPDGENDTLDEDETLDDADDDLLDDEADEVSDDDEDDAFEYEDDEDDDLDMNEGGGVEMIVNVVPDDGDEDDEDGALDGESDRKSSARLDQALREEAETILGTLTTEGFRPWGPEASQRVTRLGTIIYPCCDEAVPKDVAARLEGPGQLLWTIQHKATPGMLIDARLYPLRDRAWVLTIGSRQPAYTRAFENRTRVVTEHIARSYVKVMRELCGYRDVTGRL